MSRITDEYLSEVCRVISRGFDKAAFPMLDGVHVSWAVWLRHALDLDHIDTLEARAADGIVEAADLLERLAQTVKDLTAERDDAWRICATWRERAHAAEAKEIPAAEGESE